MTNLKELAHKYYKEMGSDSKRKSAEAEHKLCKLLNHVINKMRKIEVVTHCGVHNYPVRIDEVEYEGYYNKLPDVLECNYNDSNNLIFRFESSWFDLDYKAYYEELKAKSIGSIKYTIEKVEQSLEIHRERIQKLSESNFSDIEFDELILEEE